MGKLGLHLLQSTSPPRAQGWAGDKGSRGLDCRAKGGIAHSQVIPHSPALGGASVCAGWSCPGLECIDLENLQGSYGDKRHNKSRMFRHQGTEARPRGGGAALSLSFLGAGSGPALLCGSAQRTPPRFSPEGWRLKEGEGGRPPEIHGKSQPPKSCRGDRLWLLGPPSVCAVTRCGASDASFLSQPVFRAALPSSGARKLLATFSKLNSCPGRSGVFPREVVENYH